MLGIGGFIDGMGLALGGGEFKPSLAAGGFITDIVGLALGGGEFKPWLATGVWYGPFMSALTPSDGLKRKTEVQITCRSVRRWV